MGNVRRRTYRAPKRHKKGENTNAIRLLFLSSVVLIAVIFKMCTGVGAADLYHSVSDVVTGKSTYSEAISTLGENIMEGASENAVLVFGKKLLNIDGVPEQSEPGQTPDTEKTTDDTPEVYKEPVKETIITQPENGIKIVNMDFVENLEGSDDGYEDDTLDEPFEIPTPDLVDDNEYELPFKYKTPLVGAHTSGFGYRVHPISGETTFHYGVDIAGNSGKKISSFADGVVVERGVGTIFGNYAKVQHDDGFLSFYAHMSKISVKKGERVKLGTQIGLVGTTGTSTGPHLHFEVRKDGKVIDPTVYLG